ncbi:MAG: hypothetical protein WBR18_13010 [Anaerolineales bacterium]
MATEPGVAEGSPAPIDPHPDDYAVVWTQQGEFLPIRETAGISSPEIAQLTVNSGPLLLTGESTMLGSSRWVEVSTGLGSRGWVPFFNLTEEIPAEGFCRDSRPPQIIDSFQKSIEGGDAGALRDTISARRGLIIRHDPWNPEVQIPLDQIAGIFVDPHSYDWGTRFGSQTAIQGSFADVIVPELMDAFEAQTTRKCNQVVVGRTADAVTWPAPYTNLNFYSVHRPASLGGNPYNWRSWLFGFEYIDGIPYIALVLEIRPQV